MDDREILRQYVERQSEQAFAELVARHVNMVYAAALRLVRESHLAQDVSQSVFMELAKKARTVREGNALSGWLYRTTCCVAANVVRTDHRRRQRENEAVNRAQLDSDAGTAGSVIAPLLDDAMQQLNEAEQNAVVLRFFEGKSLREVGLALTMSEDAAQKRISRALEKLRAHFVRSGVSVSSAVVATALTASSAPAAPAGLAAGLTATSLAGTSAATTSTFANTLLVMKTKIIIIATVGVAAVTAPWIIQHQSLDRLRQDNLILQRQAADTVALREEISRLSSLASQPPAATTLPDEQFSELLRLRGEVGRLRQQASAQEALQKGNVRLRARPDPAQSSVDDVASAKAAILDPATAVDRKVAALRILRSANARSDDIVKQMLQVYHSTVDANVRADIFRQLNRVTIPELKTILLEAVRDPLQDSTVREEAAETLSSYLPDPDVQAMLEHLAAEERDPKVRAQAAASLEEPQRRRTR